jgi:hypothetical protein
MPIDKIALDDDRVSHREAVLNGQTYRTYLSLDRAFTSLIESRRLHTRRPKAWKVQGYCVPHSRVAGFVLWLAISDTFPHPAGHAGHRPRHDGVR